MLGDTLLSIFCAACLIVNIVLFLRHSVVSRTRNVSSVVAWSHAQYRALKAHARRLFASAGAVAADDGALTSHVQDAVCCKRRAFATKVCRMFVVVYFLYVSGIFAYLVRREQRFFATQQTVLIIAYYPVVIYMAFSQRPQSAIEIRCFFVSTILAMGLFVVAGPPDLLSVAVSHLMMAPYRAVISVLMMDARCVCFANSILSITVSVLVLRADDGSVLDEWRDQLVICEVFNLFALATAGFVFQEMLSTSCLNAIELKASRSETYAAVKVLDAMCDAVVQLDEGLRVVNQEAKLAALLLHGPDRFLTGTDFRQFFQAAEARQSFEEWLRRPHELCGAETGFEAMLRDSGGSMISVEMFHVPFEKVPGKHHHFVGLRERSTDIPASPQDAYSVCALEVVSEAGVSDGSNSVSRSTSTSGSFLTGEEDPVEAIDFHPALRFDISTFKVTGASAGFSIGAHGPPRRGGCLLDCLPAGDVNDLFFDKLLDTLANLMGTSRTTRDPLDVRFRTTLLWTPRGCRDRLRAHATVRLVASWPPGADIQDPTQVPEVVATVAILSAVQVLRRRAGTAARPATGSLARDGFNTRESL